TGRRPQPADRWLGFGSVDCGAGDQAAWRTSSRIQPQRGWVRSGNPDSGGSSRGSGVCSSHSILINKLIQPKAAVRVTDGKVSPADGEGLTPQSAAKGRWRTSRRIDV